MFTVDLAGAAVKLYQVIRQDRELADWLRLIFSCIGSAYVAGHGTEGASLLHGTAAPIAHGAGLLASAVAVLTVLLSMKQGRSLLIAAPTDTVKAYQTAGQTIIEPADHIVFSSGIGGSK